jgi:ABC-2 type transport system ATP-binding protein
MPAIEVRSLSKSFGGRRAVEDLSFSVDPGECFGLLGPNGAGKTTTLRMLAGLFGPDQGAATIAGCEVRPGARSSRELRRRVGLLTEHPGFYDRLDSAENLVHFGRLYGLSRADATARSARLLERFLLAPHALKPFAALSRGMKQKLAIARALLHEPEVVLLDEPTVGLDPEATREVRAVVGELRREGRTIVLCTHDLDEVERLCARAAFVATRLIAIHQIAAVQRGRVRVDLAAPSSAAAAELRKLLAVRDVQEDGLRLHVELSALDGVPDVVAALVACGARVAAVQPVRDPLEEAYMAVLAEARSRGLLS